MQTIMHPGRRQRDTQATTRRAAAAGATLFILLCGVVVALAVQARPELLLELSLAVLALCAVFTVAAFAVSRRRPLDEPPALEAWHASIAAVRTRPGRRAVGSLLAELGLWPYRLAELGPDARDTVRTLAAAHGGDDFVAERLRSARRRDARIAAIHLAAWLDLAGVHAILRELVAHPDVQTAHAAVTALARIGDGSDLRLLLESVGAVPLPPSRLIAALEAVPASRLLPALRHAARHESSRVRFWVAYLLGHSAAGHALSPLLELSRDDDADVRANAAEALGATAADGARPRLEDLLGDESWVVQAHAAKGLHRLGATPSVERLAALLDSAAWWVRYNVARAIESSGSAAHTALQRLLHSGAPTARAWAADILIRTGYGAECARRAAGPEPARSAALADARALLDAGAAPALPASLRTLVAHADAG